MALQFDGTDDKVDHGVVFNNPAALTISFWIFYIAAVASDRFMGKIGTGTVTGIAFNVAADTDRMVCAMGGGVTATAPDGSLPTGSWKHFSWVYDGGQGVANDRLKLWIDGVSAALTYAGTIPTTIPLGDGAGNDNFKVGTYDAESNFSNTRIAHLKIVQAALTEAQIQDEMHHQRPALTGTYLLWAPYDDSAIDYSGSGKTGTVTGAIQVAGPPVSYGGHPLIL